MRTFFHSFCIFFLILSCKQDTSKNTMSNTIQAPITKQISKELSKHNDIRVDEFYWLKNRENQEVIDYLNDENNYYDAKTAHTKDFQN